MTAITGGCLCGAVRFQASSDPVVVRTCWCKLCQALGGGSATVNAGFRKDGFTREGEVAVYECVADSGSRMFRSFCPKCGTDLFSEAEPRPHMIFIRAGALDDPDIAAPEMTIWTRQAPKWAVFDPALPTYEGQAPPPPIT